MLFIAHANSLVSANELCAMSDGLGCEATPLPVARRLSANACHA
jgi:hypothetical protein